MTAMNSVISLSKFDRLPPAYIEPMSPGQVQRRLDGHRRVLGMELVGDGAVYYMVKSYTRVDIGSWFGPRRVWALALADHLLCFACGWMFIGPAPVVQRIGYDQLTDSIYNPVLGAVVLAPAQAHGVIHQLKCPPVEGYQLLAQIFHSL